MPKIITLSKTNPNRKKPQKTKETTQANLPQINKSNQRNKKPNLKIPKLEVQANQSWEAKQGRGIGINLMPMGLG